MTGTARSTFEPDLLLNRLRLGDGITHTKYDRLTRSLRELLDIVHTIQAHSAAFRSLAEDIDTTMPAGWLVFDIFESIAQLERARTSNRTKEGLEAALRRGRLGGRPPALSAAQKSEVRQMCDEELRPLPEIAELFRVSVKTVRRVQNRNAARRLRSDVVLCRTC